MRNDQKLKTLGIAAALSLLASAALAQVPSFAQPPLQRQTFTASFSALAVPQTGAGDAVCLVGSATKTIWVQRVQFSGFKTTLQPGVVANLVKRTVANTGGTSSAGTIAKMDSNNGAATAVLNGYTVVPTPGAGANVRSQYVSFAAATTVVSAPTIWDFSAVNLSQPVVLRGVAQALCVNFPAAFTTDGPALSADFTWSEQ